MTQFTINIPDELLPALIAEFSLIQGSNNFKNLEEYFSASVIEIIRQRAEIYKVGPYYVGPVNPQFNQDGTLFGVTPEPEIDPGTGLPIENTDTTSAGGAV